MSRESVYVPSPRLRELAQFLRARREGISTAEAGLPNYGRRRTPGLRREEVALLAGIGVAWYSKLEMAHEVKVSSPTLMAIAGALKLNQVETKYLFALADVPLPRFEQPHRSGVPEALEQLVSNTQHVGLVLWDRYMTALRWNSISDAMFDYSSCPDPIDRNSIVRLNRDEYRFPYYGVDYEQLMRSLVGIFRRAYTIDEPTPFARRVYDIANEYPLFRRFWNDRLVSEALFDAELGPFERHHPVVGPYSVVVSNVKPLRRDDLILRIMAPADDAAVEKFARLAELGKPSTRETLLPV